MSGEKPEHARTQAEIYQAHHEAGSRLGFTFGGEEKGRLFAAWIGTGRRILDVGCRDGTLTKYYAERNSVIGVDVDRNALAECSKRLAIETLWVDVSGGLGFQAGSFDVVVASEVLEHMPWPQLLVKEIARVLRPGGEFVGSVPNAFRLKNRLLFLLGREYETDPTHLRRFSITSLRDLLRQEFVSAEIRPVFGRLLLLSPRLFGNTLAWRARRAGP